MVQLKNMSRRSSVLGRSGLRLAEIEGSMIDRWWRRPRTGRKITLHLHAFQTFLAAATHLAPFL